MDSGLMVVGVGVALTSLSALEEKQLLRLSHFCQPFLGQTPIDEGIVKLERLCYYIDNIYPINNISI
jgi:hypothetical protein